MAHEGDARPTDRVARHDCEIIFLFTKARGAGPCALPISLRCQYGTTRYVSTSKLDANAKEIYTDPTVSQSYPFLEHHGECHGIPLNPRPSTGRHTVPTRSEDLLPMPRLTRRCPSFRPYSHLCNSRMSPQSQSCANLGHTMPHNDLAR